MVFDMENEEVNMAKPVGAVLMGGADLSAIQHKFYNGLLYVAREQLRKDANIKVYKIPLPELKKLLDTKKDRHNRYYQAKIVNLMRKIVHYGIMGEFKTIKGSFVLISSVKFITDNKTNSTMVEFEIPEEMRFSIIDPESIYASINLVIIKGLKGRYAIVLYELIKQYVNFSRKSEIPEIMIEEFRDLFGLEGKYTRIGDLKKRVIEPAVKEINNNDKIEFLVNYKLKKQGNAYTHIKFIIKPKAAKLKLNQQANKIIEGEVKENPDLQELILLLPTDLKNRAKIINIVLGGIENKGKEYTKAQIEYVIDRFNKGKIQNVEIYLKKAIEEDYAGAEVIDLGDVIDDWKQKLIDIKKIYTLNDDREYLMKAIQDCDEDGMCDVQFVSTENSEKIEWARVPEEKLKKIIEKK